MKLSFFLQSMYDCLYYHKQYKTYKRKKLLIATKYRKEEKYNKLCKIHMENDNILLKDMKEDF